MENASNYTPEICEFYCLWVTQHLKKSKTKTKVLAWLWEEEKYFGNWEEETILVGQEGCMKAAQEGTVLSSKEAKSRTGGSRGAFQQKWKAEREDPFLLRTLHQGLYSCEYDQGKFNMYAGITHFQVVVLRTDWAHRGT